MDVQFGARPPAEAVEYLRAKTPNGRFSFDWRDVWQDEHLTSFVVAKMMSAELLRDVQDELLKAIEQGWTRERFIRELRPLLEARGWWGRQDMRDPVTGQTRNVQLGSPRRLKVIYDTNMRMAHAAGRWQRIEAAKGALPYLVYVAVLDERTREQHRRWHHIVLPVDHPFWTTHYPPNGWRCRCIVLQMSAAVLERRGLKVSTPEELEAAASTRTRPWLNGRSGVMETVPIGIDPGFAYNVGQHRRRAMSPPPAPEEQRGVVVGDRYPRALPAAHLPRRLPKDVARQPGLTGADVFDRFAKVLGVPEGAVFFDRAQIPLVIDRRLFEARDASGAVLASKADKSGRGEWAEVLAATLRDPDEIWSSFQRQEDGGLRLIRTYVAAFEDPTGDRYWFSAVFTERGGWWYGVTAFPPGKVGRPDNQAAAADRTMRVGALIYRRR